MTVNELAKKLENHDRYNEFLDDLDDRKYPAPGTDYARGYECNDQFNHFWSRVADGEDLDRSDYVA